jgi:hypothetical protein
MFYSKQIKNVEGMFEIYINLLLMTAEPCKLSPVTRYCTSRHMGIERVEITIRVNSRS